MAFLSVSILTTFQGCTKESTTKEEASQIYSEMLSYANSYATAVNEQLSFSRTKSNDGLSFDEWLAGLDLSCVDGKFLKYIDIYTQPDNVNDWNELDILEQVNNDPSFSPEEKNIFVQSIATAYFLKNEFSNVVIATKADAKQCEEQFYTDIKRATRNAALGAIFAIGTGAVGALAVTVYYYFAIDDAEEDYNRCMAQ